MQALSWWWWQPWSSSQVSRRTCRSALASMGSSPAPESLACMEEHSTGQVGVCLSTGWGSGWQSQAWVLVVTKPIQQTRPQSPSLKKVVVTQTVGDETISSSREAQAHGCRAWQGHRLCSPGLSLPDVIMYTVGSRPNYFLNGDRV